MAIRNECHPHAHLPHDPQDTELKLAAQFANQHIRVCLRDHPRCNLQSSNYVPTRLIDVGPSDGSREPRLLVTSEMQDDTRAQDWHQKNKYAALSYCWGKKKSFFKTTRDSLESLQVHIPWAKLPQTIEDAIVVVRALGIQYLWVDALCIIQDSLEDWRAEAAKMGSVYGGAFLTISAALGPDVDHGLSRTTSQEGSRLEDEPLYKRAWALQERILSPHLLIFGSDTLYWECQTKQVTENGTAIPKPLCFRLPLNPSDGDWYKIVRDYTCRLMTQETDKLPALAGLAIAHGKATRRSYMLGLWKESLLDDLLWRQSWFLHGNKVDPSLPARYRAPSWSWASLDGNITRPVGGNMNNLYTEVVSTFDGATEIITISEENNEWICLNGPLLQTSLESGSVRFGNYQASAIMDPRVLDDTVNTRREWREPESLSNVWCLLLGTTDRKQGSEGHGLILARTEEATAHRDFDVYTRIGVFLICFGSRINRTATWDSTTVKREKSTVYII
jgi:hypothetical protein